jgi:hypothetical protein
MAVVRRATTNIGASRARERSCACLLACLACTLGVLAVLVPAVASAAGTTTHTSSAQEFPIPASERVKDTTSTSATTPASATSAKTTPGASTPATTTPSGGAQPGTVAPATTTPAGATTSSTPAITTPATTSPSGTVVVVVHKAKPKSTRLSTGALVLAVLGALLVLACIAWALARWLAFEPRWTVSLMYSLREASSRASATWAEFSDWVRLGH